MTVDEVIADEFRNLGLSQASIELITHKTNFLCPASMSEGKRPCTPEQERDLRLTMRSLILAGPETINQECNRLSAEYAKESAKN